MDQMVALCGQAKELLALRCQPCEIEGRVVVPETIELLGIDSGVRHATGGTHYAAVRTGAFIGARMLAQLRGLEVRQSGEQFLAEDPDWRGYLANCDAEEFRGRWADALPETIRGADFLARFGGHADPHSPVDPQRSYAVRAPTRHPIEENARVQRFRTLLQGAIDESVLHELGDLMFASHQSYSECGLGNEVTDYLVDEVRKRRQRGSRVFGAKVTGAGQGGTVVILGEHGKAWFEALRIKKDLLARTGHSAGLFRWSSPGAEAFGTIRLAPRNANGP